MDRIGDSGKNRLEQFYETIHVSCSDCRDKIQHQFLCVVLPDIGAVCQQGAVEGFLHFHVGKVQIIFGNGFAGKGNLPPFRAVDCQISSLEQHNHRIQISDFEGVEKRSGDGFVQ